MSSDEYSENLGENLNRFRKEKKNCDVEIKIGNANFSAHRIILQSRIEFFDKMFNAEMKEKNESVVTLDPTIVSPEVFENILNYIYTSELDLTNENAASIYIAANFFYDKKLMKKTESFLETNLKVTNVSSCLNFAMRIGSKFLEEKCTNFILKNSSNEAIKRDIVSWFSVEDLKILLEEFRKLSKQEKMFYFAVSWVEFDKDERESELPELLECIPLTSLRLKFLQEVVGEQKIIRENMNCLKRLVEAFIQNSNSDSIYVFGGKDEDSSVLKFDSSTGLWSESTKKLEKRSFFDCAIVEDKVYLCGGYNEIQELNTFEVFETKTQTFRTLKPMKYARSGCGVAALNGYIYVAGGWDGANPSDLVEKYSIETNEWKEVSSMQTKRSGLNLVELDGKLYALGGFDGNDASNTIECYDPEQDRWEYKTSMKNKASFFGAVNFENKIYVVGKYKSEVYNPQEDMWEKLPSPNKFHIGRSLMVFKGKLLVIEGRIRELGDLKSVSTVQYYDFASGVWKTAKDMNIPRSYHATAVVSCQPNSDSFNL